MIWEIIMDLRVQKTYNALIGACTALLSQRRYEDITVAMLCEEAMIRRTTFYKHFADKAEFFSFYVESLRTEMVERGRHLVDEDSNIPPTAHVERVAILIQLADYLLEHENLMNNIFESSMSGMLLVVVCDKAADTFYQRALSDLPEGVEPTDDLKMRCEFAAGGVVRGLLKWWSLPNRREQTKTFVRTAACLAGELLDR